MAIFMAPRLTVRQIHLKNHSTYGQSSIDCQSHLVRQNERAHLIFACMLHPSTSCTTGWIFIHLRHRAALTKPHYAYSQKLGAPVRSTLLDDFVGSLAPFYGCLFRRRYNQSRTNNVRLFTRTNTTKARMFLNQPFFLANVSPLMSDLLRYA